MKKILLPLFTLSIILISCTQKVKEKPFLATDVDSITIKDGADNPMRLNIKFSLGLDSTDIINRMVFSEQELTEFVTGIFTNLKYSCKYPRTFKPKDLIGFEVLDTVNFEGENILHIQVLAVGYASNAYGVESDVSEMLDLMAWKEILPPLSEKEQKEAIAEGENPYDYTYYWHIYRNEQFWAEQLVKDIAKAHQARK